MDKQGYIYKITNNINHKIYIGQTINSIERRFKQHLSCARNNTSGHLYFAMRKYGLENFTIEILEKTNVTNLNEREKYYITLFNSTDPKIGYNILNGGGNGHITHPEHNRYTRPVNKYDLDGNFITSIKECAEANNMAPSQVSICVLGKIKSWNNAQYKYQEDMPEKITGKYGQKQVAQYDLDDNFIQQFESIAAAGRAIKASSPYKISDCCNGKLKTAYKFKWRWI